MKTIIKQTINGYVLEVQYDKDEFCEGETDILIKSYVNDEEDESNPYNGFINLVYDLIETFGIGGSRYSKARLKVDYEPGDKYEAGE